MSKQILPFEVRVGDKLRVEQNFGDKGSVLVIGEVYSTGDEFVSFTFAPRQAFDLHPWVGMPNVLITRLDS